jgi:hypothetical protein
MQIQCQIIELDVRRGKLAMFGQILFMIFHQNRLFVPELSGFAQHFNFFEGKTTEVKLWREGGCWL